MIDGLSESTGRIIINDTWIMECKALGHASAAYICGDLCPCEGSWSWQGVDSSGCSRMDNDRWTLILPKGRNIIDDTWIMDCKTLAGQRISVGSHARATTLGHGTVWTIQGVRMVLE